MLNTERKDDQAEKEIIRGGQRELAERVLDAGLCSGCGACVNICPYQAIYRDRTVVLHHCDLAQGRCYACCPGAPTDREGLLTGLYDAAELTPELGAVKGFYIARAADEGVRRGAQHGGTVTALVALALREGLIDAAVLADAGDGLLPRPATVREPEEALRLGKSRFVVSPAVAEFNRAAQGDAGRIGIVATPCQALALAKMRVQPVTAAYGGIEKLGLVVGLFCGWALSWRGLASLLGKKTDLAAITGMDIPPSRYHSLEVYTQGGIVSVSLDEVISCVRESCLSCPDMTAEFSDISVGSARLPEGWEAARSWNQVIVRTSRGAELLELARRKEIIEFREVPAGNLEKLKAAALNKKKAAERAAAAQNDSILKERTG